MGLTAASAIIAVVTVGLGLSVALLGETGRRVRILLGGLLAGLGVTAMHYTGMAAMRLNGDISYASSRVAASVAIAVVAATVALWLALTVSKPLIIFASALVMGVAVNGMHFTGMSAMSVHEEPPTGRLSGATASTLLIPIGLAVVFAALGLVFALMAAPTAEDRAAAAYLAARRQASAASAAVVPARPIQAPGRPVRNQRQPGAEPAAPPDRPPVPPVPLQPTRQTRLGSGNSNWTYRDRTPR